MVNDELDQLRFGGCLDFLRFKYVLRLPISRIPENNHLIVSYRYCGVAIDHFCNSVTAFVLDCEAQKSRSLQLRWEVGTLAKLEFLDITHLLSDIYRDS